VPDGEFIMGSETGDFNERPVHTVYLDDFYIDQYEVTNWMYEVCVYEGVCRAPERIGETFSTSKTYGRPEYANYPVDMINWHMAKTYCEWRGARLPSEAEWEKAARGTDERSYPWGEGIDCQRANYDGCVGEPVAVGSYESGKSVYGASDMAGNVWEWVSSVYQGYPFDPNFSVYITQFENRVARGGSWADLPETLRTTNRTWLHPWLTFYFDTMGFRCAMPAQ
jgi:formylglycine-generating enzyme required for sulfatase activity